MGAERIVYPPATKEIKTPTSNLRITPYPAGVVFRGILPGSEPGIKITQVLNRLASKMSPRPLPYEIDNFYTQLFNAPPHDPTRPHIRQLPGDQRLFPDTAFTLITSEGGPFVLQMSSADRKVDKTSALVSAAQADPERNRAQLGVPYLDRMDIAETLQPQSRQFGVLRRDMADRSAVEAGSILPTVKQALGLPEEAWKTLEATGFVTINNMTVMVHLADSQGKYFSINEVGIINRFDNPRVEISILNASQEPNVALSDRLTILQTKLEQLGNSSL